MQSKPRTNGYRGGDLWKGLVAGFIGGLVASWTLNRFQDAWMTLAGASDKSTANEFRDVWDGFAEGLGEPFEARASKSATPEVLAEV